MNNYNKLSEKAKKAHKNCVTGAEKRKLENGFEGIVIKEDYVSYKIARLLQEKKFDEVCYACYEYFVSGVTLHKDWMFEYKGEPVRNTDERIKCPTSQMAMKWLRELYDIHIVVFPSSFIHEDKYTYSIYYEKNKNKNYKLHFQSHEKTFEDAVNEAIEYCLTNLI